MTDDKQIGREAIKLVTGVNSSLKGKLLYYDALVTSFNIFQVQNNMDCPLCGSHPAIHELGEYSFVCESKHGMKD